MEKKDALRRWQNITPDQEILPHFTPIAADARGSTFGACGIRISGNPEFIDAVLSRLKDLLAAEAGSTRLTLSRQPVKTVAIGDVEKKWNNADTDAETCYIQVRERTARTRQRKVREHSDELPNLSHEETLESIGMGKTEKHEPMPLIPGESKVVPMTAAPYWDKSKERPYKESPYPDDGFFVASTDEE